MGHTMADAYHNNPPPLPGRAQVLPRVLLDLNSRAFHGLKKYGTTLHTHNGRSALQDAYEEALDLVMYLKQKLMEEESKKEKSQ